MGELREFKEFIREFEEEIRLEAEKNGNVHEAFVNKMISYIDQNQEPISSPWFKPELKIKIDAFSYDEDEHLLNLFVAHYDQSQSYQSPKQVSMTQLLEIAKQAKRFFDLSRMQSIYTEINGSYSVHDLAKLINNSNERFDQVNIIILTNLLYRSNKAINLSIRTVKETTVQVWDIERVYQLISSEQGIKNLNINFEKEFGRTFEMMYVQSQKQERLSDNFDCYIGFLPAILLAKAYDAWGPQLVERNVRSFLQARGETNKGIKKTLEDREQRQLFVAYNNGISSVANNAVIDQINKEMNLYRIKELSGWQIVNGGQTTASIHQAYKKGIDLTDVYVQMKLTILKFDHLNEKDRLAQEDEMISNISKYANTQNKINKSDLEANSRLLVDLERMSRNTWIPMKDGRKAETKWYFERARGQYLVDIGRRKRGKEQNEFKKQYPKTNVLTKIELAKHFMSWEGYPHIASKGGEKAFEKFIDFNADKQVDERFFKECISRTIIYNKVYEVVKTLNLPGYRANVVYYTVAMFNHLYGDKVDLMDVWNNQMLHNKWDFVLEKIAEVTREFIKQSAGDRNVTQWAKQEACWIQFKKEKASFLSNLI